MAVDTDANISAHNLTVDGSGTGGAGAFGGTGYGAPDGEGAWVQAQYGGTLALTGTTTISADGTGGAGRWRQRKWRRRQRRTGHAAHLPGGRLIRRPGDERERHRRRRFRLRDDGRGVGGNASLSVSGGTLTGGTATLHADASPTAATPASSSAMETPAARCAHRNRGRAARAGTIDLTVENGATAHVGVAQLTAIGNGGSVDVELGYGTTANFGDDLLFADNLTINSSGTIDVHSQNGAGIDVTNGFSAIANGLVNLSDDTNGSAV